ncbi:DUF6916 family protein [Niveispirillum irakense]|uniref:DUF6916 family protein n=1 Tax=Niveispirillum irakense TaxID=34011 RepID=UPI0004028AEC|nr:hypothetical protein [Niveispirillum irakense]
MSVDISTMSAAIFLPHLNENFQFLSPVDQSVVKELELTTVIEKPEFTPRRAKRTAFTLRFEALAENGLGNGTYLLNHPTEGPIGPLFVVRTIPMDPARPCFELNFN